MECPVCLKGGCIIIIVKEVKKTIQYRVKSDGTIEKIFSYDNTVEVTAHCTECDYFFDDQYITLDVAKDGTILRVTNIEESY